MREKNPRRSGGKLRVIIPLPTRALEKKPKPRGRISRRQLYDRRHHQFPHEVQKKLRAMAGLTEFIGRDKAAERRRFERLTSSLETGSCVLSRNAGFMRDPCVSASMGVHLPEATLGLVMRVSMDPEMADGPELFAARVVGVTEARRRLVSSRLSRALSGRKALASGQYGFGYRRREISQYSWSR